MALGALDADTAVIDPAELARSEARAVPEADLVLVAMEAADLYARLADEGDTEPFLAVAPRLLVALDAAAPHLVTPEARAEVCTRPPPEGRRAP